MATPVTQQQIDYAGTSNDALAWAIRLNRAATEMFDSTVDGKVSLLALLCPILTMTHVACEKADVNSEDTVMAVLDTIRRNMSKADA
jgi:hypothetical protein